MHIASTDTNSTHGLGPEFEVRVGTVTRLLQEIIARSSESIQSPARLSKAFGIDRALGWRIWNACKATDHQQAAYFLSGANALERFSKKAAVHGIDSELCSELRIQALALDSWIEDTTGDRTAYRMMIRPLAPIPGEDESKMPKGGYDADRDRLGCFAHTVVLSTTITITQHRQASIGIALTVLDFQSLRLGLQPVLADVGLQLPDEQLTQPNHSTVDWHDGPGEAQHQLDHASQRSKMKLRSTHTGLESACSFSLVSSWQADLGTKNNDIGLARSSKPQLTSMHHIPATRFILRTTLLQPASTNWTVATHQRDCLVEFLGATSSLSCSLGNPISLNQASPAVRKAISSPFHTSAYEESMHRAGIPNANSKDMQETCEIRSSTYYPVGMNTGISITPHE